MANNHLLGSIFVLAQGRCTGKIPILHAKSKHGSCWDGVVTNPTNPTRRDVHMLLAGEYIVVQWNQDNPGVWPFHCHIAWVREEHIRST